MVFGRMADHPPASTHFRLQVYLCLSNREIAVALGKSTATVKNQVGAILQKLAVSSRARLFARLR